MDDNETQPMKVTSHSIIPNCFYKQPLDSPPLDFQASNPKSHFHSFREGVYHRFIMKTGRLPTYSSFLLLLCIPTIVFGASWGKPCDPNPPQCDPVQFLECSANICICEGGEAAAYFSSSINSCVLRAGEICISQEDVPEAQSCTVHGYCNKFEFDPPICYCEDPYMTTVTKKCAIPYQAECTTTAECDGDGFFQCLNDGGSTKCLCPPKSTYDPTKVACLLDLHEECSLPGGGGGEPTQECELGAECKITQGDTALKCNCLDGLSDIGIGCRAGHAAPCSDELLCDETRHLDCGPQGICTCLNADKMWYDEKASPGICKLRAGQDCTESAESLLCYPNSFCTADSVTPTGVCQCEGYTHPNRNELCFLEAGQRCIPDKELDQCDSSEYQECDKTTAKCHCIPGTDIIQESFSTCRIKSGASCTVGGQLCVFNADCLGEPPVCTCGAELFANSVGRCVREYEAACGGDLIGGCDSEGFQYCNVDKCKCMDPTTMVFDTPMGKCTLKVGVPCEGVVAGLECTSNADCTATGCGCRGGFIEEDGKCIPDVSPQWFIIPK